MGFKRPTKKQDHRICNDRGPCRTGGKGRGDDRWTWAVGSEQEEEKEEIPEDSKEKIGIRLRTWK